MVKGVAVASEPEDFRSASAVAGMREAASAVTPVSVTGGLTKKSTPFVLPPLLTQLPRWGMPPALRSSGCLRGSMFISLTPTRR
ncbi:MAG: hypothetical protein MJY45_00860 [Bacteroidales bacterium]|nr:hypothetical protein [Bacteroidales bacterium]